MSDEIRELFATLDKRKFEQTKVVVRYGDCEAVRERFSNPRWRIQEIGSRNSANGKVNELCITNW